MSDKVYIVGEVDGDAVRAFLEQVDELEPKHLKSGKPIEVVLSSEGGYPMDALAIYQRMVTSPVDFHVTAYGLVASAAVLILAGGEKRAAPEGAWIMMHQDQAKISGSVSELSRAAMHYEWFETQWSKLLAERTGTWAETWATLHAKETYITADAALRYNLLTELL